VSKDFSKVEVKKLYKFEDLINHLKEDLEERKGLLH